VSSFLYPIGTKIIRLFVLSLIKITTLIYYKIMGNYVVATDANFDELINSDQPVLVDFWAEWCGPCKMIGPIVEELAGDVDGQAIVAKMDVDGNSVVPAKFGIRSIPTLLIFKNGEVVDRLVGGNIPKAVLSQTLLKHA
jgi:thioredoxin 1